MLFVPSLIFVAVVCQSLLSLADLHLYYSSRTTQAGKKLTNVRACSVVLGVSKKNTKEGEKKVKTIYKKSKLAPGGECVHISLHKAQLKDRVKNNKERENSSQLPPPPLYTHSHTAATKKGNDTKQKKKIARTKCSTQHSKPHLGTSGTVPRLALLYYQI